MTTHDDLIVRLEAATGQDRELDVDIHWAVNRARARVSYNNAKLGLPLRLEDLPDQLTGRLGRAGVRAECPEFTSSIDAALTLVPEGWTVANISQQDDKTWFCELREGYLTSYNRVALTNTDSLSGKRPKTPALALCIAALRARQSLAKEPEHG